MNIDTFECDNREGTQHKVMMLASVCSSCSKECREKYKTTYLTNLCLSLDSNLCFLLDSQIEVLTFFQLNQGDIKDNFFLKNYFQDRKFHDLTEYICALAKNIFMQNVCDLF